MNFYWLSDVYNYYYTVPFYSPFSLTYSYNQATGLGQISQFSYVYTGSESISNAKVTDWRSDFTQAIANYFQPWNAIRRCENSTGQVFINSIAVNIENIYKYWQAEKKECWLETADLNQPGYLNRIDIPLSVSLDNRPINNLLINGGLQFDGLCRYNLPEGWTDKFSINTSLIERDSNSVTAGQCIKATIDTGEYLYFGQTNRGLLFSKGENIIASCWYKNPNNIITGNSTIQLKVKLTNNSGLTNVYSQSLKPGTNNLWTKEYLYIPITEDVTYPEVSVEGLNSSTGQYIYYFDAFMLEKGISPNRFDHSRLDVPHCVKITNQIVRSPISLEIWNSQSGTQKIPVFYIEDREQFLSRHICPTRVSVITGISDIGITNRIYGTINSNYDIPSERGWLLNPTGFTTYRWPNTIDIEKSYGLAEPSVDQANIAINDISVNSNDLYYKYTIPMTDSNQLGYLYNLNLEAFTIKDDKIWAVGLETYKSDTYRVLKIIDPRTEYNKNYLELIKDYKLSGLGSSGVVTSVGFSSSNPANILVTMTGLNVSSGNYINLKWDYFTIDFNRRQIFTRELYTGSYESSLIT